MSDREAGCRGAAMTARGLSVGDIRPDSKPRDEAAAGLDVDHRCSRRKKDELDKRGFCPHGDKAAGTNRSSTKASPGKGEGTFRIC